LLKRLALILSATGLAGASPAAAQNITDGPAATPIRFTLDRPVDGADAAFVVATTKGYFRSEGVSVTTQIAKTPDDAIARVAEGISDIALADINALIRFRDTPNAPAVKAVFVLFNAAPYAIVARKSRGIATLSDLPGRIVGIAPDDQSIRLWPDLAARNGILPTAIKRQIIGAAVREPMLVAGQVDAVTGFSYLSAINLRNRGIPAEDLVVLRFADYGSPAYGAALMVNPKFAAGKPEAVRAFLRATLRGLQQAIKNPGAAIDAVMAQMNGGDRALELERLRTALRDNIVTAEVHRNGFGAINTGRLDRSIAALALDHKFHEKLSASDIFDPSFLPPADERRSDHAAK
jgi:NitT/TauT family transport system substrate-binding protein